MDTSTYTATDWIFTQLSISYVYNTNIIIVTK